jgi:hypothetical protein
MLQTNPTSQVDPVELAIIQCLRVFARRGRVLRQEQAEKNKTVDSDNLGGATLSTAERQNPTLGGVQP